MKNNLIPIVSIIGILLTATTAFAATDFNMVWSGNGDIAGTFNSGDDAVAHAHAIGATSGQFYAVDTGIDYYGYGVDDSSAWMRGDIINGGSLNFNYARTDSYESMYGNAGQVSNSFVGSSGTGSLDFRAGSNYAAFGSGNYGWQNDAQFTATGATFDILHTLTTNNLNGGSIEVWKPVGSMGIGSAVIDHMSDDTWSTDQFNFGAGAGCYTNADILATGSGMAIVQGYGDNFLQDNGYGNPIEWSMPNGGSYASQWTYANGLSVTNYAFQGS